jgi:hypothetical protein
MAIANRALYYYNIQYLDKIIKAEGAWDERQRDRDRALYLTLGLR